MIIYAEYLLNSNFNFVLGKGFLDFLIYYYYYIYLYIILHLLKSQP